MSVFDSKVLASNYNKAHAGNIDKFINAVQWAIGDNKSACILDVGCGSGRVLLKLRALGCDCLYGVEASEEMFSACYDACDSFAYVLCNDAKQHLFYDIEADAHYELLVFSMSLHLITKSFTDLSILDLFGRVCDKVVVSTIDRKRLPETSIIKLFPELLKKEQMIDSEVLITAFQNVGFEMVYYTVDKQKREMPTSEVIDLLKMRFVSVLKDVTDAQIEAVCKALPTPTVLFEDVFDYFVFEKVK